MTCGVWKSPSAEVHASSSPRCWNAIREQITALINPVPTVLSQVTAACPGFMASNKLARHDRPHDLP